MITEPKEQSPLKRLNLFRGVALVTLLLAAFPVRRAFQYAADPAAPKDCPPISPEREGDKPTRLQVAAPTDIRWAQQDGTINDASCLNRTRVFGVVEVRGVEDIRRALRFARVSGLKVAIAGVKHSMGGHAFAPNGLVLDMTKFNRLSLDDSNKILTAESGASWHDIQLRLHPKFAVKAMQSTDIFTIGGSISVNAHGMDHRAGSVGRTIRAMRVMLPDGSIRTVSRTHDPRLFHLIVGGYGLFGIILDVDLEVTDNVIYQSERRIIDYRSFPNTLRREILPEASYELMYGHLSTAPQTFLEEMIVYAYRRVETPGAQIPPLGEVSQVKLRRLVFNLSKQGSVAMRLKWAAEKYLEPRLESCTVSRNQALGEAEACFVSRNDPMHDSVPYLRNNLPGETDILHEYFIPADQFVPFIDGMRTVLQDGRANLLNASVRVVHREENFLTYAPADNMLAIVLYLNQTTDRDGNDRMVGLTRELIDLCARVGGRFFLPYQLHYTAEQLERSYPEVRAFFEAKREFDPDGVLTNTFYEKYSKLLSGSSSG